MFDFASYHFVSKKSNKIECTSSSEKSNLCCMIVLIWLFDKRKSEEKETCMPN